MRYHYEDLSGVLTPSLAMTFLKSGNERFLNNMRVNRNLLQLVNETAKEQFPFACILSCSDSRVPVELIFDQGLGDIFSIRLAGNIASINAIASMEYACKVLGSKLVVVMGHTNCGAIKGACAGLQMGNLNALLDHIKPGVNAHCQTGEHGTDKQHLDRMAKVNVEYQMRVILEKSDIIRNLLHKGEIGLVGAIYNVETGRVRFYEQEEVSIKEEKAVTVIADAAGV